MTSRARIFRLTMLACFCLAAIEPACASALEDDLTRCMVGHITPSDEDAMLTFTFALISLSPKLTAYTSLTDAQRGTINQAWADLHTRLLTKDCRAETVLVFKAEGEGGIIPGLKTIAGAAMRAMLASPQAHASVLDIAKLYRNTPQMDALRAQAGLPPNSK